MNATAEIHAMNAYHMGSLECGCSRYDLDIMGCDHTCEGYLHDGDGPKPTKQEELEYLRRKNRETATRQAEEHSLPLPGEIF